ncbi:MAG TPA: FtsX-like permease family protein [Thermoanaerobaculia bacterium]|nr:FtsX-like permease family protein [Thermoanaerobaculia bacterium]
MNVPAFLARRFLGGRKGGLLGTVSTLALFGVALGAAALVVAMGLMSGYRHDLAEKLAGTNAEVLLMVEPGSDAAALRPRLAGLPGVTHVAETAFAPAIVVSSAAPRGTDALVKALDLPGGERTTPLLSRVPDLVRRLGTRGADGRPAVLLGAGLAKRVGAGEGSPVVLETSTLALGKGLSPPRRTPMTVAAVVETGFSEVDDNWAVMALPEFERIAPPDARAGIWELKLARPSESDRTVEAARSLLGASATVLDWKAMNRDLFTALAIQQTLLFVVLTLIVAVAAGTVVSSLVVLLAEKTRDVGVLAALGAPPAVIHRTFRLAGLLLGGAGLLLGIGFGVAVCAVLTAFRLVRFPPEIAKVYYLSWMPFRPEPLHLLAVLGIGLLLVLLASHLPARRAARLNTAEALRYE